MMVRHSRGRAASREFIDDLRDLNVTRHVAQNTTKRSSGIDA
jgi:hypothetical protein